MTLFICQSRVFNLCVIFSSVITENDLKKWLFLSAAYDLKELLRTAYWPFAYCVRPKTPLNTAYQKGGVTLNYTNISPNGLHGFKETHLHVCSLMINLSISIPWLLRHSTALSTEFSRLLPWLHLRRTITITPLCYYGNLETHLFSA